MLTKVLLLSLFCLLVECSTRVKVNNYCPQPLTITETINGNINVLCKIDVNGSCYKDYTLVKTSARFQNGWSDSSTIVDVDFNWQSFDYYYIDLSSGFDYPVSISASNGDLTLVCLEKGCPVSSDDPTNTMGQAKIGGTIKIEFCPATI